ncbi:MAG: hypothetical protein KGL39_33165 [Patescibacteria group bacterium]|nr:hypothetical protein [Patescibacteria group bacterium]
MNKSWHVHYLNKYPGGHVRSDESSLDVYAADGTHRVALRKSGQGNWVDRSEEMGLADRHDLAPIPKDARVHKLVPHVRVDKKGREHTVGEKIGLDEEADSRRALREGFMKDGRVMSCAEIGLAKFDEDQRLRK